MNVKYLTGVGESASFSFTPIWFNKPKNRPKKKEEKLGGKRGKNEEDEQVQNELFIFARRVCNTTVFLFHEREKYNVTLFAGTWYRLHNFVFFQPFYVYFVLPVTTKIYTTAAPPPPSLSPHNEASTREKRKYKENGGGGGFSLVRQFHGVSFHVEAHPFH